MRALRPVIIAALSAVLLATASTAIAQPKPKYTPAQQKAALDQYNAGRTKFNLGKFAEAIGHYEKGYLIIPEPSFLFNIAQAYRQWSSTTPKDTLPNGKQQLTSQAWRNCTKAIEFYRRYIRETEGTTVASHKTGRKEAEQNVARIRKWCVQPARVGDKDGDKDRDPKDKVRDKDRTGDKDRDKDKDKDKDQDKVTVSKKVELPRLLHSFAAISPTLLNLGRSSTTQVTIQGGVGYVLPMKMSKMSLDVGAVVAAMPVPFDNLAGTTGTTNLTALVANAGASYFLTPKINLRAELGAGVLIVSALPEGDVLTAEGRGSTGPLSMFNLRIAVGAAYALTKNITFTAMPIFSYSPPKAGLADDITGFTRLEVAFGIGYRM